MRRKRFTAAAVAAFPLAAALLAGPLPAGIWVVNLTSDSLVPIPGELRWAIDRANTSAGSDVILFAIPGLGVHTIVLQRDLPALTDHAGVLIDGLSQPGSSAGANPPSTATLQIALDGSAVNVGIRIYSDNNTVRGLVIHDCASDGIHLAATAGSSARRNLVYCNFVGTDASGTQPRGNGIGSASLQAGIHVGNFAGGTTVDNAIDGNLVSANYAEGIWIEGPRLPGDVAFQHVTHNYVGTDVTGTVDLGNAHEGIALTEATHDNDVTNNLVSGNDTDGIGLQGFDNTGLGPPLYTRSNLIADNSIGVDVNLRPLPNALHGIAVGSYGGTVWGFAPDNVLRQNVIAYNGGDGVSVVEHFADPSNCDRNRITQNAIWDNGGLGVDLGNDGVTANDPCDFDTGANEQCNVPVIGSITYSPFGSVIAGTLPVDPSAGLATVELFVARPDPSASGEGQWYLGAVSVPVVGACPNPPWTFATDRIAPGQLVTAVATDQWGNSSEFAVNAAVPTTPSLTADAVAFPARLGGVVNFALDAGPAYAARPYLLVGSMSGTSPGTPLGALTVPLNADFFTNLMLTAINGPVFQGFFGSLDGAGRASARLDMTGLVGPSWSGTVMHYGFVLFPFDFASNPVAVAMTAW